MISKDPKRGRPQHPDLTKHEIPIGSNYHINGKQKITLAIKAACVRERGRLKRSLGSAGLGVESSMADWVQDLPGTILDE
jgi:hypothetical protein